MQAGWCEVKRRERKVASLWDRYTGWKWLTFYSKQSFIKEFCSKRGFYKWNFVVTVDVNPANSNRRILGSGFEILENFAHRWFVWRMSIYFCISVVKTFGTGVDIWDDGIIDFGRWWNQVSFLWMLVDTNYWVHGWCLGPSSGPY